jgi:predicted  nucleic acid-binding Zn-ribbon protein
MSGVASLFREIHRLRRFLRDLQENLDRIPRTRKAHQAKLAKAEQTLRDEQEAIKKLKVLSSDKEKQLKAKGDAIERYRRQQNEVTSKKEHDALLVEIAHARDVIAALENDILQAMSDYEERQARLPDAEKALAAVKADLAKFDAEAGTRKATLESEMAKANALLKEADAKVPADHRPQYDRTVSSLGPDGFAVVNDKTCTECYTEITRSEELRLLNDDFAVCPRCGRLLYLPEKAREGEE